MLLRITTTHTPATDLGYLLHKHPDKLQTFELAVGKAHVFYPEKSEHRCTACLLLDIDPIAMVRGARHSGKEHFALAHYVNDRPYVASSFLSVAIAQVFSSALNGKCKDKPDLVHTPLPLEVTLTAVPAPKGGEALIRQLFEPLGYAVTLQRYALDPQFPEWGDSHYFTLTLTHTLPLQQLLAHLYVLIPTLDTEKHYFVSDDEIAKLQQKGEGWLGTHPAKEQIVRRYLMNLSSLTRHALQRLNEGEDNADLTENGDPTTPTATQQRKETLHDKRIQRVADVLVATGATRVLDLGCGEGKLIRRLLKHGQFSHIAGMDVSYHELLKAKERLHWDELSPRQRDRLHLFQGSLLYRDKRLQNFDAAAVIEVIEHLDLNRLRAFERTVFEFARPLTVVVTTPNQEYNVMWESLSADTMRHDDHRFEWTRAEFADWAHRIAENFGYTVRIEPIGEEIPTLGAPSQMAIFAQADTAPVAADLI